MDMLNQKSYIDDTADIKYKHWLKRPESMLQNKIEIMLSIYGKGQDKCVLYFKNKGRKKEK